MVKTDDFKFSLFSDDSPVSSSKLFSSTSGTSDVELPSVPLSDKRLGFRGAANKNNMLPLVFLNPEIIASSSICMGIVYTKKDDPSRFCVLPNCNARSRNNKKASYPEEASTTGCYFILTNSAQSVVWIRLFCPKHLVQDSLSSFFYQSNERSFKTWSATFGLINEAAPLDLIQASLASDGTVKALLAPETVSKQRQAKSEIQPSPPPPFIHKTSLDDWIDSGIPADLVAFLH